MKSKKDRLTEELLKESDYINAFSNDLEVTKRFVHTDKEGKKRTVGYEIGYSKDNGNGSIDVGKSTFRTVEGKTSRVDMEEGKIGPGETVSMKVRDFILFSARVEVSFRFINGNVYRASGRNPSSIEEEMKLYRFKSNKGKLKEEEVKIEKSCFIDDNIDTMERGLSSYELTLKYIGERQ